MSRRQAYGRRLREYAGDPHRRRWGYAVLLAVLAVLSVFPQPYVARARIVPQDSSSIGLGSTLNALGGQLQGFASLFGGGKQQTDMYLAIARGNEVTQDVLRQLKLVGPDEYASEREARVDLARKVDIHSLTGGIIEIEVRTHDAERAQALTRAYAAAVSKRIVALGTERTERKRKVVLDRFKQAATRVSQTETALESFRRRHNLAAPEAQLGSEISLRTGLQARLQARQVELQTLSRMLGPENPRLLAVQSDIASLQGQIARAARPGASAAGPSVAGLSELSGEYLERYRDYRFAQALYEVYARSSEEVAVETLAGETASDVQVIEAPRLDADRKLNIPAVALLALVALAALFTEIYAPATGVSWRSAATKLRQPS